MTQPTPPSPTDRATEPTGRIALVSGASRGIGAAIARRLAYDGHQIAIGHRSGAAEAETLAKEIEAAGGVAITVELDITDAHSVDRAVTHVETELGPITILVNNAGVTADGLFLRMDESQWRLPLETNLDGTYRLTHRVLRPMLRARWGRIVNLSSVVALTGSAGQANYAAAKAALIGLSRSLARELADRSITVNVVAPGPIATDMLDAVGDERTAELTAAVPLKRLGRPEEVAAAVSYLSSEAAAYTTGAILPVDGGLGLGH